MKRSRFLKTGDIWLLLTVAIAALLFWVWRAVTPAAAGGRVEVTLNGAAYGSYPLDTPCTFTVTAENGGYNTVRIADGGVQVIAADCPDCLCVRRGVLSYTGEAAVCLPHGLVLTVREGATGTVDFISG